MESIWPPMGSLRLRLCEDEFGVTACGDKREGGLSVPCAVTLWGGTRPSIPKSSLIPGAGHQTLRGLFTWPGSVAVHERTEWRVLLRISLRASIH